MKKLVICWLFFVPFSFAQTNYARMLNGVNYQTGTTYTFVQADGLRVTQFNNASPVAVTLPNGSTAGFQGGAVISTRNAGAGTVTITCSSCTINGGASLTLATGSAADMYSDGLNYLANVFSSSGGTPGGSNTQVQFNNSGVFGGISLGNNQIIEGTAGNPVAANFAPPVPHTSAWYVARNCGSMTNCTQIKGDGQLVIDATSNSTTTITCPNNDCNFTAADVGKKVWATTQGTGLAGFLIYTTYVCPVTTISTVNSAQSITVGTACTANATANAALYWATDDGTALNGLDAQVGCANVYFADPGIAGNYILTSKPFLVTGPTASQCDLNIQTMSGAIAPAMIGTGFGASNTTIAISPDFNWSLCKNVTGASTNVCLGGTARTIANIQVIGSGLTSASNANCANATNRIVMSATPSSSTIYGVDMAGVCPGEAGLIGIELNSFDESFYLGGVQEVGAIAVNVHAASGVVMMEDDMHNANVSGGLGVRIENNSQAMDISSIPVTGVSVLGQYQTRGTHFYGNSSSTTGVSVGSTGVWFSYGDYVGNISNLGQNQPGTGVSVTSGGQVQLTNTLVGGITNSISNAGQVISTGGNKLSSLPTGAGTWSGYGVMTGTCRGTATSSATLGLYIMGQSATTACTSTTVNLGLPVTIVPLSGSVFGLSVSAGTGCKSGNTCVFTVLKNGSSTSLTCSLTGGASACQDSTHFDVPVAGDTYSIQFTTGATETLANVTATLINW